MSSEIASSALLQDIKAILEQARAQVKQTVNSAMVQAYWKIGQLIVENEQQGNHYGKEVLRDLSKQLSAEYGKGFDASNLRRMRKFYQLFPIWDALRPKLGWTHYRVLIRIENEHARTWYMQSLTAQLKSQFAESERLEKAIKDDFVEIGYEL